MNIVYYIRKYGHKRIKSRIVPNQASKDKGNENTVNRPLTRSSSSVGMGLQMLPGRDLLRTSGFRLLWSSRRF